MFGKLLKYEFKSQQKLLTILSFAALGAGLVGGMVLWFLIDVLETVENTAASIAGSVMSSILLLGVILGIVGYVIAVWILLLYRFYKHHFSEEGYLTFTLPVTAHQTLLASIVNIVIWELITLVTFLCAMCLMFAPGLLFAWKDSIPELKMVWQEFRFAFSELGDGYFAVQVLLYVSSWVYSLIIPLTCITLGCLLTKKYRILTSFAIYYGLQLGMSLVSGVLSVVITVSELSSGAEDLETLWLGMVVPCVLQLALAVVGYFLTHRMMSKKLNLP